MDSELTSDDPDERRNAVLKLYRNAKDEPSAVAEFAPILVELVEDDDVGPYAGATLRRLVEANALDPQSQIARLRIGDSNQTSIVEWVKSRWKDSSARDQRATRESRNAAKLVAGIAKERRSEVAAESNVLVAALDHDEFRRGAIEALFHVATRSRRKIDEPAETFVLLFEDDDPEVRGHAIGIVGQLGRIEQDGEITSHFDALLETVEDPHVAVRQTALGVLLQDVFHWSHALSPADLARTIETIEPLRNASDETVRSRAKSLDRDLVSAALIEVVRHAIGCEGSPNSDARETLVELARIWRDVALKSTSLALYHAGDDERESTNELLARIVETRDEFQSVEDLRNEARSEDARIPKNDRDVVSELCTALVRLGEA